MRNFMLSFSFLFFLFSCQEKEADDSIIYTPETSILDVRKLKSYEMNLSQLVSSPRHLLLIDEYLVITDLKPQSLIHIFNIKNGDHTTKGIKGYGPGEIMSSWSLNNAFTKGEFWIGSPGQKTISRFTVKDDSPTPVEQIKLKNEAATIFEPLHLKDSLFIGSNMDGKSIFTLFNKSGDILEKYGNWKNSKYKKYPSYIIESIYEGRLRTNKNQTKVLYSYLALDMFMILDLKNKKITKVVGPFRIEPQFKIESTSTNQPIYSPSTDTLFGYIDSFISDNSIYVLYSGKSQRELMSKPEFAIDILEFDITGQFNANYKLDRSIKAFTVDENNGIFYGITTDENPTIVKFNFR